MGLEKHHAVFFLLEKDAKLLMKVEIWNILTLTCHLGSSWELWFNGLVPLWKGLALAWTSPGHHDPLSQGKTGMFHGRWVIAVDDTVQIKKWD